MLPIGNNRFIGGPKHFFASIGDGAHALLHGDILIGDTFDPSVVDVLLHFAIKSIIIRHIPLWAIGVVNWTPHARVGVEPFPLCFREILMRTAIERPGPRIFVVDRYPGMPGVTCLAGITVLIPNDWRDHGPAGGEELCYSPIKFVTRFSTGTNKEAVVGFFDREYG